MVKVSSSIFGWYCMYVDSPIEKFPITREKQYRISAKKCDGKTMAAQMKHYRELNADVVLRDKNQK